MTHSEKRDLMYLHMQGLGIGRSTSAPPAWRLLWRLGIEVPPPLFTPFLPGALAMGAFFSVFWGLAMWALMWARQGMPVGLMALTALCAGALFGLTMATYYRYLARKHRLPSWAHYSGAP